jgi:uncharacterized protein YbjT (DUF2867 family)
MSVILVTGATGRVGRQVVSRLHGAGVAVRALTRDPGAARLPAGVDVVRGDLTEPAGLAAHLGGVDAVFLVWPFFTAEAAPAAVAAIAGRARRLVYLSAATVPDDPRQEVTGIVGMHAGLERLIEGSGLEWTFLRSGGFATNTLGWAPQILAGDVVRGPYGGAARSLIHERDLAAVASRVLTSGGHAGARYVLTGPEAVTESDQVRTIGEAIGRPLRHEEVPREVARRHLLERMPAEAVDAALDYWAGLVAKPEVVTDTVRELTGAPAHTFREWAADHAGDFRPPSPRPASEAIVEQVRSWPGVSVAPHRFGGVEFRVGRRELGHLHGDRLADMPFTRALRDELLAAGRVVRHGPLPDSGWASRHIRTEEDVRAVVELLRLQYDRAVGGRGGS